MRQRWHELLRGWAANPSRADEKFDDVCNRYAGPGRFYHTLEHAVRVVEMAAGLAAHARQPQAVELAAWLHDVIFDSRAADNEERSAAYAEQLCRDLSIPERPRVAELIRKTRTHDAGEDADARVLLDADLAILGASEADYEDYARNIRQEYGWVPEPDYRQGRRQILERFLARPRIYHLLHHLEEPAHRNLAAEIARLA